MKVAERTVRTARVELPGGRVVCAGLWPGEPGEVVFRVSAPESPPGGRSESSLRLPADALPELREALAALDPEEAG